MTSRLIKESATLKNPLAKQTTEEVAAAFAKTRQSGGARRISCFKCGRRGQIVRNCRSRVEKGSLCNEERATIHVSTTITRCASSRNPARKAFVVDSGASRHIANQRNMFITLRLVSPMSVEVADGRTASTNLAGDVKLLMLQEDGSSGCTLLLKDVLYCEGYGLNMMSCSQLDSNGICTVVKDGKCMFLDRLNNDNQLGYAELRASNNLFQVRAELHYQPEISENRALTVSTQQGVELCHLRLCHIGAQQVTEMFQDKSLGINLSARPQNIDCITCIKSRMAKSTSSGHVIKAFDNDTCVHSDICGPFPIASWGMALYFVSFSHAKSRYAAVLLVKRLSELNDKFQVFMAKSERQMNRLIVRVHSANGGEYIELKAFLTEKGIEHDFSPA